MILSLHGKDMYGIFIRRTNHWLRGEQIKTVLVQYIVGGGDVFPLWQS